MSSFACSDAQTAQLSSIFRSTEFEASFNQYIGKSMAVFACPTHDYDHVMRVARLSGYLAISNNLTTRQCQRAYIAGLSHDLMDSKLAPADQKSDIRAQLETQLLSNTHLSEEEVAGVILIATSIGYKNLIKTGYKFTDLPDVDAAYSISFVEEYKCVQDADLLDAIGAIGVARCFAFSGKRNRALFGPITGSLDDAITSEAYAQASSITSKDSAIQHFFDKLFRIPQLLQTSEGKLIGAVRQANMKVFIRACSDEIAQGWGDTDSNLISNLAKV